MVIIHFFQLMESSLAAEIIGLCGMRFEFTELEIIFVRKLRILMISVSMYGRISSVKITLIFILLITNKMKLKAKFSLKQNN